MNLKSGGGKAERFGLVDACRQRGIRPIVLEPGDDLRALAQQAIADGTDVIGMDGTLVRSRSHRLPGIVLMWALRPLRT